MLQIDNQEDTSVVKGNTLFQWSFPEFEKHTRSLYWYIMAVIVLSSLFFYSLFSDNFIFAIIIVLFVIILINGHKKEPADVNFVISELGFFLNEKFYGYDTISKFWVIYKAPDVKKLYFQVKNMLNETIMIPMGPNISPLDLRDTLAKYLEEDLEKENEPITESLGRIMKI